MRHPTTLLCPEHPRTADIVLQLVPLGNGSMALECEHGCGYWTVVTARKTERLLGRRAA